jgi:acyl carrier protein
VERMVAIWEKIFGSGVRPDSDFFEDLDGDSMAAAALVQAVADELGVSVSMVELFDHPTPAEFSAVVEQSRTA